MRLAKLLSAAAVLVFAAVPASAAQVEIGGAWFRALPAGLPAGGYFVLHNSGKADAELTGAQSPACGMVMLHKSIEEGGMGRMVHVESVTVPAHGKVEFKPGGYHLMCMKPTAAMTPGKTVAVMLQFADGTQTVADFHVKSATGK